jgi:alanine racemase
MKLSRRTFLGTAALAVTPRYLKGSPSPFLSQLRREDLPTTSSLPPERFDPWVEVIPGNVSRAVSEVRRLVKNRPIIAVVKNNGYGLEIGLVGRILQEEEGILGFAVVKGEEALKLRAAGVTKPILLMGMFSQEEGAALAEAHIEFSAFTPDALERLIPLARTSGGPIGIHCYLDTGMGRMGMTYRKALPWLTELGRQPELQIRGTFTELGEDPDFDPEQIRRLHEIARGARAEGVETGPLHAASSNGVFHLPQGHLDLVRPGIALFGSYPSRPDEERQMAPLHSALRLKARVVRVSHLQQGDGVGYGRPWIADRPTWVATLPIGHADGYPREATKGAHVLVKGEVYPVIGGVSASHCIVEVGDHRAVQVGDIATLMGPDHPALDPNNMAETLGVSVYDLLMHVNPTLPRVLVDE